jgi:hypothetical protein
MRYWVGFNQHFMLDTTLMYSFRNTLLQDTMCVQFIKRDGSERSLFCSLSDEYLPTPVPVDEYAEWIQKIAPVVNNNPNTSWTVWDIEAEGWRRFRLDSIQVVYERDMWPKGAKEGYVQGKESKDGLFYKPSLEMRPKYIKEWTKLQHKMELEQNPAMAK